MPLCPLFQPVSPFPCYVLARGALGKMSGIRPALGVFFFLHLLFLPPHRYNSGGKKKKKKTCQMIISVNICQVTESPCSSVVRATLIYWMCERAAEETQGLTWYFSGWLSLPANWFQQCFFFFLSFFSSQITYRLCCDSCCQSSQWLHSRHRPNHFQWIKLSPIVLPDCTQEKKA